MESPESAASHAARDRRRAEKRTHAAASASSTANAAASSSNNIVVLEDSPAAPRAHAPVASAVEDDDECCIVSPPKQAPITTPAPPPPATGTVGSSAGIGTGEAGEDDDEEVVFVGVGRAPNPLPHARHDCTEHPLSEDARRFCENCWCARCDVPVGQCSDWAAHCSTSAADASALRAEKKAADVKRHLASLGPRPPPLPPHSEHAQLAADPRWPAMRFTSISYLLNMGHDLEGVQQALVACHEGITHDMADRVRNVPRTVHGRVLQLPLPAAATRCPTRCLMPALCSAGARRTRGDGRSGQVRG